MDSHTYNKNQFARVSEKIHGVLMMVPTCRLFLKGLQIQRIKRYPYKIPIDLLKIKNTSSRPVIPCKEKTSLNIKKNASFFQNKRSMLNGYGNS